MNHYYGTFPTTLMELLLLHYGTFVTTLMCIFQKVLRDVKR